MWRQGEQFCRTIFMASREAAMAQHGQDNLRSSSMQASLAHEALQSRRPVVDKHDSLERTPARNCSNFRHTPLGQPLQTHRTHGRKMQARCLADLQAHGRRLTRPSRRVIRAGAVQSASFLGDFPPKALETVQTIREAIAHSTIGPYAEIASEDTLIINPPWAKEPRATVTQPLLSRFTLPCPTIRMSHRTKAPNNKLRAIVSCRICMNVRSHA